MAAAHRQLVLIHTPHLEDKYKGTRITVDVLRRYPELEAGARAGRSRRGAHHRDDPRARLLGRADALSADQDLAAARRRHDREVRPRSHLRGRRLRLGAERSDRRAALRHGDAAPPPSRGADPAGRLREPGARSSASRRSSCCPPSVAGGRRRRASAEPAPATCSSIATSGLHLTYCTNIHPGDGWAAVDANIRRYAPALKARLSPAQPFGLGLRLSARDARELLEGSHLDEFRALPRRRRALRRADQRLSLRAVPRHAGQGGRLRAGLARRRAGRLHARPDPTSSRRLLPRGVDGGVSTAPLTYKPWMRHAGADAMEVMTAQHRPRRRGAGRVRRRARRVHPPRHRAGARLPARDQRRDDRLLRASGCCRSAAPRSPRHSG